MVSSQRFGILVGLNGFVEHRWDTRCFDKGIDGIVREKDLSIGLRVWRSCRTFRNSIRLAFDDSRRPSIEMKIMNIFFLFERCQYLFFFHKPFTPFFTVSQNLSKLNHSLLLYRKVRTRSNDYELVVEENHSRDAIEWNGNIPYLFFARTVYFIHCEKNKATKTNNKPTIITIGLILRWAFGQRKRLQNFFAFRNCDNLSFLPKVFSSFTVKRIKQRKRTTSQQWLV